MYYVEPISIVSVSDTKLKELTSYAVSECMYVIHRLVCGHATGPLLYLDFNVLRVLNVKFIRKLLCRSEGISNPDITGNNSDR